MCRFPVCIRRGAALCRSDHVGCAAVAAAAGAVALDGQDLFIRPRCGGATLATRWLLACSVLEHLCTEPTSSRGLLVIQ